MVRRRPLTFTQAPDGGVSLDAPPPPPPRVSSARIPPAVALAVLGAAVVFVAFEPRLGHLLLERLTGRE